MSGKNKTVKELNIEFELLAELEEQAGAELCQAHAKFV